MTKLKNPAKKNIAHVLALTPLQEGLLFHYLKDPGSDYYFEQLRVRISGPLDTGIFEQAWNIVIDTNEMLRTFFRWEKLENPVQLVLKEHPLQWRYYDLSHQDIIDSEREWEKIKNNDWLEKFDLQEVPFRILLAKFSNETFEMIISNHHILYDGWSNGIILKEFFDAYEALAKRREPLKRVKTSFKEFIEYLHRKDKEKECEFWQEYLAGFAGRTEMPSIKDREPGSITSTALYTVRLPVQIVNNLETLSRSNKVSMAALLYTAWGLLLQRYCNSEDIIFGTTVSGRSAKVKAIEDIVGLFINTLPLRIQTHDSLKINDLLSYINQVLQMREPFEGVSPADIIKYGKSGGGELFDSIVVIENYPLDARLTAIKGIGDLAIDSYSLKEVSHYSLSLVIALFSNIEINFNYSKNIWNEEMIQRLAGHFLNIVESIITSSELGIEQIEMLSLAEKRQLLVDFNDTGADYLQNKTIPVLFAEQAEKIPDTVAVVFSHGRHRRTRTNTDDLCITYRELHERSNHIAGYLIEKGILSDDIVGIKIERSVEMIIGIMGILKSGGAYLPIDPTYPQERIDYML
ncbi:MAG: condensation domain-containing protein, partial [Acidobacteria bacterium]|nr:condensation domain-containing protein [Acidobacteriota bacterium]